MRRASSRRASLRARRGSLVVLVGRDRPQEFDGRLGRWLAAGWGRSGSYCPSPNASQNSALTKFRIAGWLRKFSVSGSRPGSGTSLAQIAKHFGLRRRGSGRSTA